jgi:two-component system response regulator WspF
MKIAIVNDMPMAVEILRRALAGADGQHQLAWVARDGAEAVRRCAEDRPDLILMDLVMPEMDGAEATRQIMARTPCAILLVTANAQTRVGKVFEAMGAGALDVVASPTVGNGPLPAGTTELLAKIARIGLLTGAAPQGRRRADASALQSGSASRQGLVAIGASAGGPAALATVLGSLPEDFPAAIVIIQHVDEEFAPGLADWLNDQTPLPVRLATEGDQPLPGVALVAGTGDHLAFMDARSLGYTPHPRDYAYRPSVDVFFESAACHWRGDILGVLLTGMGRDGARGLKTLRDKGCHTIAQDQATCAVYGMPKQAAALGAAAAILPLGQIGDALKTFSLAKPSA